MKTLTKAIVAGVMLVIVVAVACIVYDEYMQQEQSWFSVTSSPSGAHVYVQVGGTGTSSSDWYTPCTVVADAGTHVVISVEKDGYHTMERNVYASHEGYVSTEHFVLKTDNPVDNLGRWIFG